MAKSSGTLNKKRGGMIRGDANYKGTIDKDSIADLQTMKHNDVYRETKSAISRYHSTTGVRQKTVKLATLRGAAGVHVTSAEGESKAVYLSKSLFNKKRSEIEGVVKEGYKTKFITRTNKPIAHVVTHELAHATWNSHLSSPRAKAASKDITGLYQSWSKSKSKKGYGSYAKTNVNEFFAETMTKGIHGRSDKYTRRLREIVKKYRL